MKNAVVVALACLVFFFVVPGVAESPVAPDPSRLHPALRAFALSAGPADPLAVSLDAGLGSNGFKVRFSPESEEPRIGVLVKIRRPVSGRSYRGIQVEGTAGSILCLSVTVDELVELASSEEVVYIEPAWKTEPKLDVSLSAVRGDVVHSATPGILGEDVVIGFVDTGIDYSHADFSYDTDGDGFEESSRIVAIWDQTDGLLGVRYDQEQIENDLALGYGSSSGSVRQADYDGHGTHVASIAAGDGSSSPHGFVGVAPEAWVVAVKTSFYTSDIIAAVEYVFEQAEALGMPAVVNLSLGGHEGPHDGTSLFEQALDELTRDPGRIIVVSAGNEGDLLIHTSAILGGGTFAFGLKPSDWEAELNMWYPGTSSFTITVIPPSGGPITVPSGTDAGHVATADGVLYVDNASAGVNPNNGDREAFVRLSTVTAGSLWKIEVTDEGGGGPFHAWVTTGSATIVGGDSAYTIDEPGNARGVITVGSFNTKATWPSRSGNQDYTSEYPVGVLSEFSSLGPTRDGRTKPELCAPGAWICAALSYDAPVFGYLAHPDGEHGMDLGTSMSAPHVTGAIGLLLSLDPELTTNEVRGILTSNTRTDAFTGAVPNSRWGWGKLDVAAAVAELEPTEPTEPTVEPPEIVVEENPVVDSVRFVYTVSPGTTWAKLRVYTISGGLAFETSLDPSDGKYDWTLRTTGGERLAAGLYLYVLVTNRGGSAVGRLVIER